MNCHPFQGFKRNGSSRTRLETLRRLDLLKASRPDLSVWLPLLSPFFDHAPKRLNLYFWGSFGQLRHCNQQWSTLFANPLSETESRLCRCVAKCCEPFFFRPGDHLGSETNRLKTCLWLEKTSSPQGKINMLRTLGELSIKVPWEFPLPFSVLGVPLKSTTFAGAQELFNCWDIPKVEALCIKGLLSVSLADWSLHLHQRSGFGHDYVAERPCFSRGRTPLCCAS